MIRVPEPTVHYAGKYGRREWRTEMLKNRVVRTLAPLWKNAAHRRHPFLELRPASEPLTWVTL